MGALASTLLIALLQAAPPPSTVPDAAAERDRVVALLSARHDLPPRSMFDAAAADPRPHVLALAEDDKLFPAHRYAALLALRYWPDDAALAAYRRALTSEKSLPALKHRVIAYFPDTFGPRALPELVPFLEDPDPQIRVSAVSAIARVPGHEGAELLQARRDKETHPLVKERLEQLFSQVAKPGTTLK